MLISIMPRYVEGAGDCCRVKRKGGEVIHKKKLNTILKEVFRDYCTDFCAIKKITTKLLNQKTLVPVYVSSQEIMIPLKVREPLFKGDGCYGYVNIFEIKKVFNKEILLVDGETISFLDTKRTIQKRERMAETLKDRLPGMVKMGFIKAPYSNWGYIDNYGYRWLEQVDVHRRGDEREYERRHEGGMEQGLEHGHERRFEAGSEGSYEGSYERGVELRTGLGFYHEQYPSIPEAVEEYILNLVHRAMDEKTSNNEVQNRNECN
jgi:hypothetical protein